MTLGVNDLPCAGCGDCGGSTCSCCAGAFPDAQLWGCGQCTQFAAWRIYHDLGSTPPPYGGCGWGNADTWLTAARACGVPVSSTPTRGAVLQLGPGVNGAGSVGHLAVVLEVQGADVLVEDYNWRGTCSYLQHSLPIAGSSFLYFGSATPPSSSSSSSSSHPPFSSPNPACPPGWSLVGSYCYPPAGGGSDATVLLLAGALILAGWGAYHAFPSVRRSLNNLERRL